MVTSSSSSSRSSSGCSTVHKASVPLPSESSFEIWKSQLDALNLLKASPSVKDDEAKKIDKMIAMLILSRELDPDGPSMRMMNAIDTAERRRDWGDRRNKSRKRRKFSEVIGKHFHSTTSDDHLGFRRYFRMTKDSFFKLCELITSKVGVAEFKPESLCGDFAKGSVKEAGGAICGEIRVAICIRMLAGASYLDLMVIFDLCHRSIFRCFHTAMAWIRSTLSFPLVTALKDKDEAFFRDRSEKFANGASDGHFDGCFGALDGLAIRIKRPTRTEKLRDPGAYYCRKGFHALNVQAICDSDKKILWLSSSHQGSCHDSTAWTACKVYKVLQVRSEWLYQNNWFIAGDSAYNMESFLLVPFDKPDMRRAVGQMEDNYNFYHSNCRIRIECTFGELIMRWGIFWRKLQVDLKSVGHVVETAALLHNFIIDERLEQEKANDNDYFATFSHSNLRSENEVDDEIPVAIVSDTTQPKPAGRPSLSDTISKEKGKNLRQLICWDLDRNNYKRPKQHGFKYNEYGMVYME